MKTVEELVKDRDAATQELYEVNNRREELLTKIETLTRAIISMVRNSDEK